MGGRIGVSVLAGLFTGLLLPIAAYAAIIPSDVVNVDFNVTDPSPNYSGKAAGPATAGTFWNGVATGPKHNDLLGFGYFHNFGPSGALLASDGTTVTGITVSLANINQYWTSENPETAPIGNLLNDYAYAHSGASNVTLTISGVTTGATYDLYIYSQNGGYNSEDGSFSVNGGSSATANNSTGAGNVFKLNANYVLFSGLIGPGDNTFTVAMTAAANGALDGFQLIQTPEPSSVALLAGAALLVFRRQAERVG